MEFFTVIGLIVVVSFILTFYFTLTFFESLSKSQDRIVRQSKMAAIICFGIAIVLTTIIGFLN